MSNTRQVIIGNSAAALAAIRAIREVDSFCPITVISAEDCVAYSPVLLTYYLGGRIPRENLFIVDDGFYKRNGVSAVLGSRVVALDLSEQVVRLENDSRVRYDNLLICTGATPISLIGPGANQDNVLTLRTIEDTERVAQLAQKTREAVIVGAGLIGLQTAEALFLRRIKPTIVEWAAQVFPENIDADCAAIVREGIESCGIPVCLGKRVSEIKSQNGKAAVISDSGEIWTGDMVVVGVGLRPNSQFARDGGVEVNRGILVDEFMRTNIGNVYAAGDVSEGMDMLSGERAVLATWSNACRQGRIAGLNMAGCKQEYEGGIRETITTILGMTVASIGLSHAGNDSGLDEIKFSDPVTKVYRKILLADNRIVGAVLLKRAGDAGIIGNLIRNKTDVSQWKDKMARTPLTMRELLSVTDRRV